MLALSTQDAHVSEQDPRMNLTPEKPSHFKTLFDGA
jgi:hypothetical protein